MLWIWHHWVSIAANPKDNWQMFWVRRWHLCFRLFSFLQIVLEFHDNLQYLINTVFVHGPSLTPFFQNHPVIFIFGDGLTPKMFKGLSLTFQKFCSKTSSIDQMKLKLIYCHNCFRWSLLTIWELHFSHHHQEKLLFGGRFICEINMLQSGDPWSYNSMDDHGSKKKYSVH